MSRRGIPRVREWRIATTDGAVYVVRAPTRVLAVLNLHAGGIYTAIHTVGVFRKPQNTKQIVTRVK